MNPLSLKQSTPSIEGVFRASKWLKHPLLIDGAEMRSLFDYLKEFFIFNVSMPTTWSQLQISQEDFLEKYQQYIEELKRGCLPDESSLRAYFSSGFSLDSSILYALKISPEKFLIKPTKPIIQLQSHHFFVSNVDKKFHSMVHSSDSIPWGIQFSYPQLYQDPQTEDIVKVANSQNFPNTALFARLAKWVRNNTVATPFIFDEKQTNASMRLGKNCFSWINAHPGLRLRGIQVKDLYAAGRNHP